MNLGATPLVLAVLEATPVGVGRMRNQHGQATAIGVQDRVGVLAPGRRADLVSWDEKLRVRRIWRAGREVEEVSEFGEVEVGGN